MYDAVLALGGAQSQGYVTVAEIGPVGMITLRGDLSSKALQKAATAVSGTGFPGLREAKVDGDKGLLWMSPDEVMVLCPYTEAGAATAQLSKALAGEHALAVDVSDARAVFRISGAQVREVIAKLAPVDMVPEAFAAGQVRRTRFAQVAAAFWLVDEQTAQVVCFRSVAQYMFDLLSTVSVEGSEVGYF